MAFTEHGPNVAVVGVTGAVGQEFLNVLSERDFPYSNIKLLASKRSAGKHIDFQVSPALHGVRFVGMLHCRLCTESVMIRTARLPC